MVEQNLPPNMSLIIEGLRNRIKALETGQRIGNTSINQGALVVKDADDVTLMMIGDISRDPGETVGYGKAYGLLIRQGGSLWMSAPDGTIIGYIGVLPTPQYDRPDGSRQMGYLWYRDTGELVMSIADAVTSDGYNQTWTVRDRAGNVILADDTNSGTGIARPWLCHGGWASTNVPAATDSTSSTSFISLQMSVGVWQNPRYYAYYYTRSSDASTTGETRIVDMNGNQYGPTTTVLGNEWKGVNVGPVPQPGRFGDLVTWYLQARVTGGPGTIGVRGHVGIGQQS